MFGLIGAGRPVQTAAQQVAPTKYLFLLEDAANINHIVVFLLGTTPIPSGFGAAVFFGYPPYKDYQFLGYISNEKPSAVFKLSNPNVVPFSGITEVEMNTAPVTVQIGISIEAMPTIEQLVLAKPKADPTSTTAVSTADMMKMGQKMLENLFNYALSFSKTAPSPSYFGAVTNIEQIPTDTFKKWYSNFESKIQKDPNWWKS